MTEPAQRDADAAQRDGTSEVIHVIPILEEFARVETRVVEAGGVRIHKTVQERDEVVELLLRQEEVEVERVPVGTVVTEAPLPRQEGDTFIIPVLEEVVVKQLILREELHVRTRRTEETRHETVRLRSEKVSVETLASGTSAPGTSAPETLAAGTPAPAPAAPPDAAAEPGQQSLRDR